MWSVLVVKLIKRFVVKNILKSTLSGDIRNFDTVKSWSSSSGTLLFFVKYAANICYSNFHESHDI